MFLAVNNRKMSGFGDNFEQDVDPAAEFLAREQDELAGLEDEVKPAAVAVSSTLANSGECLGAYIHYFCMFLYILMYICHILIV